MAVVSLFRTFSMLAAAVCAVLALCSFGSAAVVTGALSWERAYDQLARAPHAEPANLRGYGALAIRQGADLYLIDGDAPASHAFRRIEHGAPVRAMAWSHDGTFLAYATDGGRLWILARAAAAPNRINGRLQPGDRLEWSPSADVLLIARATPPTIALVDARGTERAISALALPDDVRWSASGTTIDAYTFGGLLPSSDWRHERMGIFSARAGVTRTLAQARLRVASNIGGQVFFAARVPHTDGIVYWHGSEVSASIAADGQELWLQAHRNAAARQLGVMLTRRYWISFSGDGRQLVFVQGGGREAWHTKSLALCSIGIARCRALAAAPSAIAVDPAWAPRGERIAFVHADDLGPDGGYGVHNILTRWIAHRTLWLATPDRRAHPLRAFGSGIFWPCWSRDAKRLMVFRDGEIWLGTPDGARPKRIATGLARPAEFVLRFFADHGVVDRNDAPFAWTGG